MVRLHYGSIWLKEKFTAKNVFFSCQAGSEFEKGQTTNLELCNYLVSTKKFMTTTFTSKLSVILNFYSVKIKIVAFILLALRYFGQPLWNS